MPLLTHPSCGKTYPSNNTAGHCAACHETFIGLSAFDAHRIGEHGNNRRCEIQPYETPTETGTRYGHWQDKRGYWHHGRKLTAAEKDKLWNKEAP